MTLSVLRDCQHTSPAPTRSGVLRCHNRAVQRCENVNFYRLYCGKPFCEQHGQTEPPRCWQHKAAS